jgi:hypothetical protein
MKIAFYKARYGDWSDYVIALFTMGPYSHVEFVFSDGMWFSASGRDGGVRYKEIIPKPHWFYLDLPLAGEDEAKLRTWCDGEVGREYDWKEVTRFVLPWLGSDDSRWFCSEIVMAGLQQVGFLKKYKKEDYAPNALYRLLIDSGFKVVV